MADRRRRALLQAGLGAGVAALVPGCVGAPAGRPATPGLTREAADLRVESVDALRALTPASARVVEVAGYRAAGDGGGGLFVWAGAHGEPDDHGTVIAPGANPDAGRWLRDAGEPLELAWFGPVGDGQADDAGPLQRAIDCALKTGLPLVLNPGTYHIASDVLISVGAGQALTIRGDGATLRRSGPRGALFFDAEEIASLAVTQTIAPGDDGITVSGAAQVAVGDLVAIFSGIRLAESNMSSWTASEYGQVVAIRGNRLVLDGPTHNRIHPNRRLAYRMDGSTDRLHYRLFWGGEAADVRVALNGAPLHAGADYSISGEITRGFDIVFSRTPPVGSEIALTTATPLEARIFRGGTLSVSGLRCESDFAQAGPVTFFDSYGLAPANSRFSDLELVEHNAPLDADGYREGVEGDLFRTGLVNSLVENVRMQGGRYAMMALSGRNTTYRGIVGEGAWHAVASFGANTVHIADVTAIRCYAAVDSHYAQVQHVDGVDGVRCRDGMNHRANGGSIRNAVLTDNTASENNGLNFGVSQGAPLDDRLVADPLDNPRVQFSTSNADMLIVDSRFAAPADSGGFGLFGSYLRRATFRNVQSDGPLIIDGAGPPPLRELVMERFDARFLVLRGVTELVSGSRVVTGSLSLRGTAAASIRFEDSVFDGAIDGSDALIDDGDVSGALECRFERCTFRNAARLMASAEPSARRFSFVDCVFQVDDDNGFG